MADDKFGYGADGAICQTICDMLQAVRDTRQFVGTLVGAARSLHHDDRFPAEINQGPKQ
jgi:hypothetical protein